MPPNYEEQKKRINLWRCDCSDEGEHISTDYHQSNCAYIDWYNRQGFDEGDNENEE